MPQLPDKLLDGERRYEVQRGGRLVHQDDFWRHGRGQIVGYPIVDLRRRGIGVRSYLRALEAALIAALRSVGVGAFARPGLTGVWTASGKLAAIGIAVRRGITRHGFALNVSTDLTYFDGIVPCGLAGVQMTSIEQLGKEATVEEVADRCSAHFAEVFDRRLDSVSAGREK